MKTSVEKLINELDIWINDQEPGNPKNIYKRGLTIHYSTGLECWFVGYGRHNRKHSSGKTLEEALQAEIKRLENA